MIKLIRSSVFETNSSSTHSLSLGTGSTRYKSLTPDDDNIIRIIPQEFGWDYDTFTDPQSKAAYILQYIRDWTDTNDQGDRVPNEKFTEILNQMVNQHTGATSIELYPLDREYYPYGYIDHQSVECRDLDHLFESPQILKDFIFGDGVLTTDNDNH